MFTRRHFEQALAIFKETLGEQHTNTQVVLEWLEDL
jgi:hypothetical protein